MKNTMTGLVVAVCALGLSACGGSDTASEPASAATSTTTGKSAAAPAEDDLRAAVVAYSDAFLTGDVAAYDMLSERCRDRTNKNEFVGTLMASNTLYGETLEIKSFDADIESQLARVTYGYEDSALDQDSEPWVLEDDNWRNDDC